MSIFAVYSDGYEDGRRSRMVHKTFGSFEEASAFVSENADMAEVGYRLRVRRFDDPGDIAGFEIGEYDDDDWEAREKAWANADFERSQGYLPYGR